MTHVPFLAAAPFFALAGASSTSWSATAQGCRQLLRREPRGVKRGGNNAPCFSFDLGDSLYESLVFVT